MALRGVELGRISYPLGSGGPGGGGPAPSFQHLRTNLAGGFVFVDEFGSDGAHSALRPNSGVDLTTLAPANWLFPDDNPGALDGPKYAQTIHGGAAGLGARALLWSHTKAATTDWDHISIWDPVEGDLFALVKERTEDGNGHAHDQMSPAVWVAPFLYYARAVSVDGSPPTVTITVYRSDAKLGGESAWASRVVPSGEFTAGTLVAALTQTLGLVVAGDGSVAARVDIDERAAADAANGSIRYRAAWDNLGVFTSDNNSLSATFPLHGLSAPSLGVSSCAPSILTTAGLVLVDLPGFVESAGWPTTGLWVPGGSGFRFLSLSPDRVTGAAFVLGTRRVIWAPADRTSGNPDGDIFISTEATTWNCMICRDGL